MVGCDGYAMSLAKAMFDGASANANATSFGITAAEANDIGEVTNLGVSLRRNRMPM